MNYKEIRIWRHFKNLLENSDCKTNNYKSNAIVNLSISF